MTLSDRDSFRLKTVQKYFLAKSVSKAERFAIIGFTLKSSIIFTKRSISDSFLTILGRIEVK